jgi:hypothetical protein
MYLSRDFLRRSAPKLRNRSFLHTTSSAKMASNSKAKFAHLPLSTSGPIECAVSGHVLLNTPYFNKGSGHSREERQEFELTGLLPQSVQTLETQAQRAYEQYSTRGGDLAKNTFLTSLKDQNLVLYYKVDTDLCFVNSCHDRRCCVTPRQASPRPAVIPMLP